MRGLSVRYDSNAKMKGTGVKIGVVTSKMPKAAWRTVESGALYLEGLAMRGDQVECNLCDGHFRRFRPFGDPVRKSAMCPRCRSMERHRRTWWFLQNHTTITRDQLRVLHFAPETGIEFAPETGIERRLRRLPNLDYMTADLKLGRADVQMDITDIKHADRSFNVVLCSHVLEHVSNAQLAISELYRVLSPDGFAIIDVPVDPSLDKTFEDWSITTPEGRRQAFGQWDHVRRFGHDYPDWLRAAGFTVKIDPQQPTPIELARYGMLEGEHTYLCTL